MNNKSIEFDSKSKGEIKKVYIKDISIYSGVSYEYDTYFSKVHRVKLYFLKYYNDNEGYVTISRDYDYFDFDSKDEAINIYNKIKELLSK